MQSFIKNGRPRLGLTNAAFVGTISLAVHNAFRLVDDEKEFRQMATADYMENYEAPSLSKSRFIY